MLAFDVLRGFVPAHLGASAGAALFAMAASQRMLAWVHRRRLRTRACREVLRAADEVTRAASALERELSTVRDDPRSAPYRERCAQLRSRADLALSGARRVRKLRLGRLLRALSRLRSDLRQLQRCRQQLQTEMLSWELARKLRARGAAAQSANLPVARAWA